MQFRLGGHTRTWHKQRLVPPIIIHHQVARPAFYVGWIIAGFVHCALRWRMLQEIPGMLTTAPLLDLVHHGGNVFMHATGISPDVAALLAPPYPPEW